MFNKDVPPEMTAVQVVEFHKPYETRKVPTPKETDLQPHDILVKTAVASYCHTDNMVVNGKFPSQLPITASHEGTGIVLAVGSSVHKFTKGDRVMSGIPRGPCGKCISCRGPNDIHQYCPNIKGHNGVIIDGFFAEYHVADSRSTCHVPNNVSFVNAAPLACAGCTIYRAVAVSGLGKDGWLAIVGAGGGLGHLGIQFARAKGLKVLAIDARDEALEVCKKYGADHILDARDGKDKLVQECQERTGGEGVDATINCSEYETAAGLACAITKMHGTMIQVAQPDNVCIPFEEYIFRGIKVVGSLLAGQEVSQEMLDSVSKHKIQVETNIFHGLDEVPKMVELSHSGKMKGKAVCVVDKRLVQEEGTTEA